MITVAVNLNILAYLLIFLYISQLIYSTSIKYSTKIAIEAPGFSTWMHNQFSWKCSNFTLLQHICIL